MGFYSALMARDISTFRKGVPGDIRPLIGQREIKVSLRTVPQGDRPHMLVELDRLCVEAFTSAREGKSFALPNLGQAKADDRPRISTKTIIPSGHAPTLSALLDIWEKQNPNAADTTTREWKRAVRYFNELYGELAADRITKALVLEFRNTLRTLPKRFSIIHPRLTVKQVLEGINSGSITATSTMSETTVNKYLTGLAAIFELGRKMDLVEHNPVSGMKLAVRHSIHDRKAFSTEELERLFSQPMFTEKQQDDSCYWPMLLGLCTGARLAEILQLQLDDIKEQSGVWYLDINQNEGKQLKTLSSIRKIPLHNDLLNLGFVEYVQTCRERGQQALFAESEKFEPRQYSNLVSKRLNRFINLCGIEDSKKTFYSLRHSFKDIAVMHDVPEEIREALMGHSNQRVSRNYGSGQFIERLNRYMQSLHFPLPGAKAPAHRPDAKKLDLKEIFASAQKLEVQEVADMLAPQFGMTPSVLTKMLTYQLSRIIQEVAEGDEPMGIASHNALISEAELQQALQAAKLI